MESKILNYMQCFSADRYTFEMKEWDIIGKVETKVYTPVKFRRILMKMCKKGILRRMQRDKWTVTYYIISPDHLRKKAP